MLYSLHVVFGCFTSIQEFLMHFGQIILLNGPSSAGKSTLAKAIQHHLDLPFWHISSDQFVEAHMLPARRDDGSDFDWRVMRPRFFQAFHRC